MNRVSSNKIWCGSR